MIFGPNWCFGGFLFLRISHLFFEFLQFSNFPKPLLKKAIFEKKLQNVCFTKTIKVGVLKGVYF